MQSTAMQHAARLLTDLKSQIVKTVDEGEQDWLIPIDYICSVLSRDKLQSLSNAKLFEEESTNTESKEQQRRALPDQIVNVSAQNKVALLLYVEAPEFTSKLVHHTKPLPIDLHGLNQVGLPEKTAESILEQQYHFIEEPVHLYSVVPMHIDDRVIMPLGQVQGGNRGSGAFGEVKEFEFPSKLNVARSRLVRKQFDPSSPSSSYRTELRSICLLSAAEHPNIIPLVAAYTHRQKHNLIMPLAENGDLEQVLLGRANSGHFEQMSDCELLRQFSGLASALACMHNLKADYLDMIGIHRDLKPANVLLTDTAMLLADFGLSRMIPKTDLSGSKLPPRTLDYAAPEDLNPWEGDLYGEGVGRKGDIWSLGCILLNIMLLKYGGGHRKIEELDALRAKKYCGVTMRLFWHQDGKEDRKELIPQVRQSIVSLKDQNVSASTVSELATIVEAMLVIEPEERATAEAVTARLQNLTLLHWTETIMDKLGHLSDTTSRPHFQVEIVRFEGWREASLPNSSDSDGSALSPGFHSDKQRLEFERMIELMQQLHATLDPHSALSQSSGQNQKQLLRHRIDLLLAMLSAQQKYVARQYTQQKLLGGMSYWVLQDFQVYADDIGDSRLKSIISAKVEQLQGPTKPSSGGSAGISEEDVAGVPTPKERLRVVTIPMATSGKGIAALAEEGKPTPNSQGQEERIMTVVRMLEYARTTRYIHTLQCLPDGLYYHRDRDVRGLLYSLPVNRSGVCDKFITLSAILRDGQPKLALGKRFALAYMLARSLSELHAIGGLHRRICAENVVLFYCNKNDLQEVDVSDFYLLGFVQTRRSSQGTSSEGHVTAEERKYYQHPYYRRDQSRFEATFDYYALGILMLEIGYWKLLPALCDDDGNERLGTIMADRLSEQHMVLKDLEIATGRRFSQAVSASVRSRFDGDGGQWSAEKAQKKRTREIEESFVREVLKPLMWCQNTDI